MERFWSLSNFMPNWFRRAFQKGYQSHSYFLGQKGAAWISTTEPWLHYTEIPELKTVIDRRAKMFSNMKIYLRNVSTKDLIEDKDLDKLLNNPNCMEGQNDFLVEYETQKLVYGNQFIYKNKPSTLTKYPIALWNISPRYIQPELTGKIFDQVDVNGIISSYKFIQQGYVRDFKTEEILFTKITDLDNPVIGWSPIFNLNKPLSNIKLSYEYRNVIMGEKGAIGMLSQDGSANDGAGALPMKSGERDRIENSMVSSYGVSEGQKRVIVTEASMKWTPMSYPTKDLLLFEEVDADKRAIIDAFQLNQNIFSSMQGTTYENLKNGLVMCYQDAIQPSADQFVQSLGKFIGIPEGTELVASFEHLSILKENKLKGMDAIQSVVNSLTQAIQGGLISSQQATQILANELDVKVIPTNDSKTVIALNSLSPLLATKVLESMTENERRALVSLGGIEGGDVIKGTATNINIP